MKREYNKITQGSILPAMYEELIFQVRI